MFDLARVGGLRDRRLRIPQTILFAAVPFTPFPTLAAEEALFPLPKVNMISLDSVAEKYNVAHWHQQRQQLG